MQYRGGKAFGSRAKNKLRPSLKESIQSKQRIGEGDHSGGKAVFKEQEGNAEPTWEAQRNSQKARNLKCSAGQSEMLNVFYTSPHSSRASLSRL